MPQTALKIIFAGTPEFAATSLRAVLASGYRVMAVLTQPDRPAGRGRKIEISPVKQLALQHRLAIWQPSTLRDVTVQQQIRDLQADLMIVAAYGLILPAPVLQAPELGCINVHASLLPRWRGAAPIQRAILAGDHETGITIIRMDEGLDTGDMLLRRSCPILEDDTGGSLHDRLASLGAATLIEALESLQAGDLRATAQDSAQASYAGKLDKSEARINWSVSAGLVDRQVRAFNPWPVAFTTLPDGRRLRIWRARPLTDTGQAEPGTVIDLSRQGFNVACGEGVLQLQQMQLPGGRNLPAADLINASPLAVGDRLGGDTDGGNTGVSSRTSHSK